MTFNLQVMILISTVKQGYGKNGYNELTLTVRFFPCDFILCCKFDRYNEFRKIACPKHFVKSVFY